jgi:hypothetical protein
VTRSGSLDGVVRNPVTATTDAGATVADASARSITLTPANAVAIAAALAPTRRGQRGDLDSGAERATAATFQDVVKVGEI